MVRLELIAALLAATAGADEHLLAGARHFRGGEFPQALVEFRVAEKLGSGEASWYAAASLVKLDRPEEAIEAFARAEKSAPAARDALLDYYRALACYGARLYLCADKLLAEVSDRSGPGIAEQVRQTRKRIAALFSAPPQKGATDWYREKAAVARAAQRPALSAAYGAEAEALAARMK